MGDLSGLRVLLVEDEGGIALLIEDMLEDLGCEVVASAARLSRAYEVLRSQPIDLAVLDVNLAGETSFDLARMLVGRNIPFVFSTGYGGGGLPADLQNQPVIAKPFNQSELHRVIAAALARGPSG